MTIMAIPGLNMAIRPMERMEVHTASTGTPYTTPKVTLGRAMATRRIALTEAHAAAITILCIANRTGI